MECAAAGYHRREPDPPAAAALLRSAIRRRKTMDSCKEDPLSQLLAALEPTTKQIEEWRRLCDSNLAQALARFENHLARAACETDERVAAQFAINATIALILSVPRLKSPDKLMPLFKLHEALQDIDDGVRSPLLTPRRPSHRPRDPMSERRLRGHAAGVMEVLMNCFKLRKKVAAGIVADELHRLGIQIGDPSRETPPGNTVASWRDHAKTGNAKEDHDAAIYAAFIAEIKPRT